MRPTTAIALAYLALPIVSAYSLIGMGLTMYHPSCAFSCRAVIASAILECPDSDSHSHSDSDSPSSSNHTGMDMGSSGMNMSTSMSRRSLYRRHGHSSAVTPECRSTSSPFLTTLSYCMNQTCQGVSTNKLESYWAKEATGDPATAAQWSYTQSLAQVKTVPNTTYDAEVDDGMLMGTSLIGKDDWEANKVTMEAFEDQETRHARYAVILLVVGLAIPILTTALSLIPPLNRIITTLKPRLIYPATIQNRHVQPWLLVCHPPTLGQATYIFIYSLLTLLLTALGYHSVQPNLWFTSTWAEMMTYVGGRTGVLAMALAPLTLLFAGRNNFLLWLTNWSHPTYLLLHRWVARLFGIQVILHSIIELVSYIYSGSYLTENAEPWYIWGIIGTFAVSIMLVHAVFRRWNYEWFLIIHIGLAILTLAGTWYHLEYRFEKRWGYEIWLYLCFAVWALDRVLRVARIVRVGYRPTKFTPIGQGIMRVDVEGVGWNKMGQHAYIYFPKVHHLTPWMNHPFSVIPTYLLPPPPPPSSVKDKSASISNIPSHANTDSMDEDEKLRDIEPVHPTSLTSPSPSNSNRTAGVTFFIRRNEGLTNCLHYHPSSASSALTTKVLLEGPYCAVRSRPVLKCDRLVFIAGGIGITAIYPFLHLSEHQNMKLHWSVREHSRGLVEAVEGGLKGIEREVDVGGRVDVRGVLEAEVGASTTAETGCESGGGSGGGSARGDANGWKDIGVMVCGPGGMCDEVRKEVVRLCKENKGLKIELDVEAFSW